MILFNRKIKFKNPPQSDIVIFESNGSEWIKNLILPDLPAYVFDSMLKEIFVSPKVVYYFAAYFKYFSVKGRNNFRRIVRVIIGQLWRIYILSCIKCFKPKIVITMVDNHPVFHWLCRHYNDAEFIAIQNGNRTKVEFRDLRAPYRIGHFFCFGEYEKDIYPKLGHKVDYYYPVGSLLSGYYRHVTDKGNTPRYDICVISGWRGNIGNNSGVQKTMESMRKMDLFLARYIKELGLTASIVLRSEPDTADRNIPVYGDEKEYFKKIYPDSVHLIDPDFIERNIYKVMDRSEFIISSGSTAIREAFGWGKKVLYCDFTGTDLYNDYDPVILFRTENYDLLKARLNEIRNMPYEEYNKRTKTYAAYLMNYDPNRPPHLFIRQKIEYYLS